MFHEQQLQYIVCRHSGPDMESMKAVALAAKARSLADFQKAVKTYKVHCERFRQRHISNPINQVQLEDDMIVAKHLTTLYSNMLEHNLCRFAFDPNLGNLNKGWTNCRSINVCPMLQTPHQQHARAQYFVTTPCLLTCRLYTCPFSGSLSRTARCRWTMWLARSASPSLRYIVVWEFQLKIIH